jgi:glycosyltransferase involved in cell wall biosynthesis
MVPELEMPISEQSAAGADALRVLFVIPGDGVGASMIFARRQVEALGGLGILIRSFYFRERRSPLGVLREWRSLRHAIREFRPHVVHAQYGTINAFLAAFASGRPLVVTFRGTDLNLDPNIGALRAYSSLLLSQAAAWRAARIICVTRQLRERLWWRQERVVVLPTGVNLEVFRPIPKLEARARLGWRPDARVVVFNAGTQPLLKGLDLLQAALDRAETRVGRIQLALLDGSVAPSEVPFYLSGGDCLALASLREGSPTIVQEALACNLPVVSVDVGDVGERLQGISPSRLVPRDPSAFGDALAEILANPARCNGRERVAECAETVIAARTCAIYRELAQRYPVVVAEPAPRSSDYIRTDS